MYAIRLLYDDHKKNKRENLLISESIKHLKPKYFSFLKKNFLSLENFEDLEIHKKILFENEDDYFHMKNKFEEIHYFRIYRKINIFLLSLLFLKRFIGKLDKKEISLNTKIYIINSNFNIIRKFSNFFRIFNNKGFRYFFAFSAIYLVNKLDDKLFQKDFADNIGINTRFGLYIWFENNYRLGKIDNITINFLDQYMINLSYLAQTEIKEKEKEKENEEKEKYEKFNEKIFNKNIFEFLLFYQMLKIYYLETFISKTLLEVYLPIENYKRTINIDHRFLKRILEDFYSKISRERYFDMKNGIEKDERISRKIFNFFIPNEIKNFMKDRENYYNEKFQINENSAKEIISEEFLEVLYRNYEVLMNMKESELYDNKE